MGAPSHRNDRATATGNRAALQLYFFDALSDRSLARGIPLVGGRKSYNGIETFPIVS